jgi:hypothetical protein
VTKRGEPDDAALHEQWRREQAENEEYWRQYGAAYGWTPFDAWKASRDREQRQSLADEELRLRVVALRREAAERQPEEPEPQEWRGPYPHKLLEEAVRLKEQGASHDTIHEELPVLSKRQARYIAKAVDAKKVWSTRYGLDGVTRTDKNGVYIPKV